ncbi:MAG: DUF1800 domain-containing protein [Acidobacteriota bacterium]
MSTSNLMPAPSRVLALAMAASLTFSIFFPSIAEMSYGPKKLTEEQKILHLLNRAGFGPRQGDVEKVKRMGIDKYIDLQLHPERINDSAAETRLAAFPSLKMNNQEISEKYPQPQFLARRLGLRQPAPPGEADSPEAEREQREARQKIFAYYRENNLKPPQMLLLDLQSQKIIRAVYSDRQLQEVMVDFWFNHFNIFWPKGADRVLTTDFEMRAIRPNTLGKFKDLLMATAKSPAMMFYLDNFQSTTPDMQLPGRGQFPRRNQFRRNQLPPNPQGQTGQMTQEQQRAQIQNQLRNRQRGINENYARELMELHTLGVDGGYTQKDVQEVARCLTGWTIDRPQQGGDFIFREFMHDKGEKIVLGHRINEGGIRDGEKVIDILAHHPNTAKFIATKLARRFVSDNPPPALVDRVAAVYKKTDGDIREMVRTILTSSEFNSAEAYRAKIKSPFELAASAIRAMNADVSVAIAASQFIARMGQPLYLYQAPTGYPDRAEQWVNTGSLLERLNFGIALSANRVRGSAVDMKRVAPGINSSDTKAVMNRAVALLLNNEVSEQTREILNKQLKEGVPVKGDLGETNPSMRAAGVEGDAMMADERPRPGPQGGRPERRLELYGQQIPPPVAMSAADLEIAKVFGLVLGSPEFQRR